MFVSSRGGGANAKELKTLNDRAADGCVPGGVRSSDAAHRRDCSGSDDAIKPTKFEPSTRSLSGTLVPINAHAPIQTV